MKLVSVNKVEKNQVALEVAVDAVEFKPAYEAAYRKTASKVNIPGFRPGKAPRAMVEKNFGGAIIEEAVNALYPAVYEDAVAQSGIEPVSRAEVELKDASAEGFTFIATVTVKPEVTVKNYKGLTAVKKAAVINEADVDTTLQRLQERNGRQIAVEGRAAEKGDVATIDFEGFVDGVAFEGGKGEGHDLELGAGQFIDGFEDQIVGHNIGDSFDVNVTFPEQYHAPELAGKPATFKTTLHGLKVKELPLLDDEFAKDVSEFDTIEELKADIRRELTERAQKQCDEEYENELVSGVIANMEADVPEIMIENRIDEMVQDFDYRLQSQGLNLDTYIQYTGDSLENFRKTFKVQAERHVKIRLALEQIARDEKLEATQEEIDAEYERLSKMYGVELDQIKMFVPMIDVANDVKCNKAIDLIKETAVAQEEAPAAAPKKKTTRRTTKKKAAEETEVKADEE